MQHEPNQCRVCADGYIGVLLPAGGHRQSKRQAGLAGALCYKRQHKKLDENQLSPNQIAVGYLQGQVGDDVVVDRHHL